MQELVREYDAKLDIKKRVILRNVVFDYYHVKEYADGCIVMEPRELTAPFQISANSLAMMDASMQNMKEGRVSDKIDLSEFDD